jgi:hypothetical protein
MRVAFFDIGRRSEQQSQALVLRAESNCQVVKFKAL